MVPQGPGAADEEHEKIQQLLAEIVSEPSL